MKELNKVKKLSTKDKLMHYKWLVGHITETNMDAP